MNQHAMWKYCIAHKWGRMYIYTEYAYIYIYILGECSALWGEREGVVGCISIS